MQTITTGDLNAKIQRGDRFHLVMAMDEAAFRKAHIPSSTFAAKPGGPPITDDLDAEIIVYCSTSECAASRIAYRQLIAAGFRNVWHYSGGLSAWDAAGLPLEANLER